MNNKAKLFIIVLICLCVLCSFYLIVMNIFDSEADKAVVYVNNEVHTVIELSDEIYKEYTIETEFGTNIITVSDGSIGVSAADCPDKTCVNTGFINNPGRPIICIPHKLEIIISGSDFDGVAA